MSEARAVRAAAPLLAAAAIALAAACSDEQATADAGADAAAVEVERLDDLELFDDAAAQQPAEGVVAYDVNAVLFADEAEKLRFLSIPEGEHAVYDRLGLWDYPDGTAFIKTFFFWTDARDPGAGRTLIETRIVALAEGVWTGRTYVWDEAQSEARRLKTGRTITVDWIDSAGDERSSEYRIPNDNECKTCHSKDHAFEPLGPRTRQLDREHDYGSAAEPDPRNQIDHLAELDLLRGEIELAGERFALIDPYGAGPLEQRARSYLDANCSHCHRPGGEAGSTALDLRAEIEDPFELGVCRTPVAAGPGSGGHRFDVVPGDPDASILVFRMASTDPEIKMPELPTLTSDAAGTELVSAWIAAMPAASACD